MPSDAERAFFCRSRKRSLYLFRGDELEAPLAALDPKLYWRGDL